jgi:hypothetical protein
LEAAAKLARSSNTTAMAKQAWIVEAGDRAFVRQVMFDMAPTEQCTHSVREQNVGEYTLTKV